jgi:hypothetical protein
MRKLILLQAAFAVSFANAQDRVITTAVPFLVSADARAAGMADIGVATSADAFRNNGTRQNTPLQQTNKAFL